MKKLKDRKFTWFPRRDTVILEARLKPEVANRNVKIISPDGEHYADDFDYFIYDMGEEVSRDLSIGDEVFFNLANLRIIHGITDQKKSITYYFLSEQLIQLRRPGPAII